MKKVIIVLFIMFLSFQNMFAYNLDSIYNKIDIIYNENPTKLEKLNFKINIFINKTKKEELKNTLIKLNKYINFKFKNKDYYNQKINQELKNKIKEIDNSSFTDQIRLEKFSKLLKENNYTFIEEEFISFSILNAKVWILLNHQNFDKAKNITVEYFKNNWKIDNNKLKFLTKNISYSDFSILPQLISWFNWDNKKIIDYRIKYFPDEKNTAYNMVRKYWYKNIKDCNKLTIKNINLDLVDKKICIILNNGFKIKDLEEMEKLKNNLQEISDLINYYSQVNKYVLTKDYFLEKDINKKKIIIEKYEELKYRQFELWKIILKNDKNFINWYLPILTYYNNKNDCKNYDKYYKLLEKNYIWDKTRKKFIFEYRKEDKCYLENN